MEPLILGIDTSCDETAAAVTVGCRILSNVVWSQIEIHRPWGGVVPDLARRAHAEYIDEVVNTAIKRARIGFESLDVVCVTYGPGLAIALEVGIKKAKELAEKYQKPLIAVNHMEGHLLSAFALNSRGHGTYQANEFYRSYKFSFPILGLLVSGGHTEMVLMKDFGNYQLIGQTLDDAAGEAFDKVAKMLNLGYPGGPIISELAKHGNTTAFNLPIPMLGRKSLDFSFSGLKTACLYKIKEIPLEKRDKKFLQDFSASFERVLIESIVNKLKLAIEKYQPKCQPKQIVIGGGVMNNLPLRREVRKTAGRYGVKVFAPYSSFLFTDNAGMIAVAGYYKYLRGEFVKNPDFLDREPGLSF